MQRVRVRVPLQLYSTNTCPQKVRERVPLQLPSTYTYPQRVQSTSTPRAVFNEYRVRIPLELSSTSTEYEYPSSCLQRVQSTNTPGAVFNEYRVRVPLELPGRSTERALCGCKNTSFPHAYTHKHSFYMSLKYGRMLVDRTPPCFSIIPPTCVQFQQIPAWLVAKRSDTPQTVVDGQWRPLRTGNRLRKGTAVFDLERTPGNASRVSGNPILSACS